MVPPPNGDNDTNGNGDDGRPSGDTTGQVREPPIIPLAIAAAAGGLVGGLVGAVIGSGLG